MRRYIIFITSLLVISQALGLTYNLKGVTTRVYPGETLHYEINFTNDDTSKVHVYLNAFMLETFGIAIIKPSINLHIEPNETHAINLTININPSTPASEYLTPLYISYNNITEKIWISSTVLKETVELIELQNLTLVGIYSTDPREPINISGTVICNVDNIYPRFNVIISDETSIVYNSSSIIGFFSGANIFERELRLNPKIPPRDYTMLVEILISGKVITQAAKTLTVTSYKNTTRTSSIVEDIFGKNVQKTVTNSGNEEIIVNLNYSTNILEVLLITDINYAVYEDGNLLFLKKASSSDFTNYLFSRNVPLAPDQSITLTVNTSYFTLILMPFFAILGVIAWILLNKKIRVEKEIILSRKEGKELIVKIAIRVKNIGFRAVNEALIIESIPLYVKKLGGFGSIKGEIDKVRRWLKFDCGTLRPKEEVLVSYKFKTDVELVGRVSLPPATVKFKFKRKIHEVKSNTPIIELIKGGEP